MRNLLKVLHRIFCHHDDLLHVSGRRLVLRCVVCGRETTGWVVPQIDPRREAANGEA